MAKPPVDTPHNDEGEAPVPLEDFDENPKPGKVDTPHNDVGEPPVPTEDEK